MNKSAVVSRCLPGFLVAALTLPPCGSNRALAGQLTRNVALNRPYRLSSEISDQQMQRLERSHFADDGRKLTDGDRGFPGWVFHGPWVGFLRQSSRSITVNLGEVRQISRCTAWFLQDGAKGIRFPRQLDVELSQDGRVWQWVGSKNTTIPLWDKHVRTQGVGVEFPPTLARMVRFDFQTDVWVFLSELEAWDMSRSPKPFALYPTVPALPPADAAHPSHMTKRREREVLIYCGYYNKPGVGSWNAEDFVRYVGYVSQSGEIRDTMFDTFLFLPFHVAPSGGDYGKGTGTENDWRFFINQLFQKGHQLDALDEATKRAKNSLRRPSLKSNVVIAIPYPSGNYATDASTAQLAAVKWYIAAVISRFEAAKYKNLRLDGFYWLTEHLNYGSRSNETELLNGVSSALHNRGLAFEWIPYNQAEGFREWELNGFDAAAMQPNCSPSETITDRLANTSRLAKRYGLSMEIEVDWQALLPGAQGELARKNYEMYIEEAHRMQLSHTFLPWYQGYQVLERSSKSHNRTVRWLYEATHHALKEDDLQNGSRDATTLFGNKTTAQAALARGQNRPYPEMEELASAWSKVGRTEKGREIAVVIDRVVGRILGHRARHGQNKS